MWFGANPWPLGEETGGGVVTLIYDTALGTTIPPGVDSSPHPLHGFDTHSTFNDSCRPQHCSARGLVPIHGLWRETGGVVVKLIYDTNLGAVPPGVGIHLRNRCMDLTPQHL